MHRFTHILFAMMLMLLPTLVEAQVVSGSATAVRGNRFKTGRNSNLNTQNYNGTMNGDTVRNDADTLPKGIIYETGIIPDSSLINSVNIFHFEPLSLKINNVSHPSLLPTGVELSDKIMSFNGDYYLYTGNLGQACYSVFPKFEAGTKFRYRENVFDGYGRKSTSINFYQTERPFTSLSYFSSIEDEYQVEVIHTQNITQRWNFSLHYNLINSEGIYTNQKTKNNYFDFTTNYYSKNLKYQVKGGIIWQKLNLQENGGISNDSLFVNDIQTNRGGMPVNLYSAFTDFNTFCAFAQQSYTLAHQPGLLVISDTTWVVRAKDSVSGVSDTSAKQDSVRKADIADSFLVRYDTTIFEPHIFNWGAFVHNIEFNKQKHNYTDPATSAEYYRQIYFDSVSTLDSDYVYTLENSLFWTNDIYKDYQFRNPVKLYFGIRHTAMGVRDMERYRSFSVFTPFAKAIVSTKHFYLTFEAEESMSSGYKNGDYSLSGNLSWQPDSNNSFNIFAMVSGNDPDLFYYRYVSNVARWNLNELEKINVQKAGFNYNWRNCLQISSSISNVANNVWISPLLLPYQTDQSALLSQSTLSCDFALGIFRFRSFNLLQFTSDEENFRLPRFATKNSLFVELKVFKKALILQTGFDLRYNTKFHADRYMPATAAFYQQDEYSIGGTPWADFFIAGQIKHATLFVKILHFNTLFEKNPSYYILPQYPGQDFTVQWGVRWRFFD